MNTRLLRRLTLVVALTFGALLPPRPAGAQSPVRWVFTVPSTPSAAIQSQQAQEFVHCPEAGHARQITVQGVEDFAGALVVFTVSAMPFGVVQFSFSLDGPFTDTLEVPVQLDATGSGTSDIHFVKGVNPGVTFVEGCSVLGCLLPFGVTVVGIADVNFSVIDSPLDTNPNPGGGLRIYPDKESPQDPVERRTVRVQAITIPQAAGLPVSFRSFDVDDPFSDDRPVDSNGPEGDDNRGEPVLGSLNASVAETDASGVAETVFTVSMKPGDNFKVAAACDATYLEGLVAEGVELRDADGNFLPTDQGSDSEMLTVWRRLHVEVDSMGNVTGNLVAGLVTDVAPDPKSLTTEVKVDQLLDAHRFEGGLIEIAAVGLFGVTDNDRSTVTLPVVLAEGAGLSFTLWDDDDFNGDDPAPLLLDGDDNEDVTAPSIALLVDGSDNGVCDYSFFNVFGAAYVCPVLDLQAASDDFAQFVLNADNDAGRALIEAHFGNLATEADPNFWTVYLLAAYQNTTAKDFDPNLTEKDLSFEKKAVVGTAIDGKGALIFKETIADFNRLLDPLPVGCTEAVTVAHEIGHLFGGEHSDGGVMSNSCETEPALSADTIATIRARSHP
jgi:hypothetical protein